MTNPYREALDKATRELAECDAAAEELECKRAKLRQTIGVLQSLLGIKVQSEQSLTDTILMAVKACEGYMNAAEVVDLLVEMGREVQTKSVATILSRLVKNGKLLSYVGPNHLTGYRWKTPTTNTERHQALEALISKTGD